MLKKVFFVFALLFIFACSTYAAIFSYNFSKVISEQDLDGSSSISITVLDVKNSKILYSKNENKMLNTASALKLYTFASALDTLGENYKFETAFYISGSNLYLKLGADPLLTKDDLYDLVQKLKKNVDFKNIKYIYIDDGIISNTPYPDGWCTDDFWPTIAPISPYIIDGNKVKVRIVLAPYKDSMTIVQNDKYRFSFINQLQFSDVNDINISKNYTDMQNLITISGKIADDSDIYIPVSNPKTFFITRLEDTFGKYKIQYSDKFYFKATPHNAKKVAEVYHTLEDVSVPILKYSDNFSSEVLFRVAGNQYAKIHGFKPQTQGLSLGTTNNAILMFNDFYQKANLDMKYIKIVDGSGVSRYNAASSNWLAQALLYLNANYDLKKYMEGADEGTLKKRLRYLKGNIYAKTGTHKGLSSLVGIMSTKNSHNVVFAIVVQCFSKTTSKLKTFEDDLVDCIFNL